MTIWWRTKFTDDQTELVYYGYRYYLASLGRWINRDPIEEDGGINLFAFVNNIPINAFDPFGKATELDLLLDADVAASEGEAGAVMAQRGISIVSRVRQAVNAQNEGQELLSVIMDSAEGDSTELLDLFTQVNNQGFGAALRGSRTVRALGEEWHHIFPQARQFAQMWERAGINIDRFQVGIQQMYHRGTEFALHAGGFGARGGMWNAAWEQFFAASPEAGQEAILKFGARMFRFFIGS